MYFKPFPDEEWKAEKKYRREYIKKYPWLKDLWSFKDNMREEIAVTVEEFAGEMKPPLGPVIRPDAKLESVLVQHILDVIKAKFEAEEMIPGPRIGYPIGAPEGTLAGTFPEITEVAGEALDEEAPSVVSYRGAAGRGGVAVAPGAAAPPTVPPEEVPPTAEPPTAPTVEWPETLSWRFIEEYLGQAAFGLTQHFNTGLPLSAAIRSRLEEIYAEYPLGFEDLASWLRFAKTLWRTSLFRGGLGGVTGLAEQPRPLGWTSGAGAGRRFTPWG